jgi:hypothetical protein
MQVAPALERFNSGVWAIIASKYPDVSIHEYAPLRQATTSLETVSLSSSSYTTPSPLFPIIAVSTGTAGVSPVSFAGVSEAEHIAAIRRLYTVINPDKMNQVN